MILAPISGSSNLQSSSGVEAQRTLLNSSEKGYELRPSDVECDQGILKGKHIVEMLILDDSRIPLRPQSSSIDDHEVSSRNGIHHESGNQVAQLVLRLSFRVEVYLISCHVLQEVLHPRQPLLSVDSLHSGMRLDHFIVETVFNQLSCISYLAFGYVFACPELLEDLITDCDRALNPLLDKGGLVELEVEDVEIVPTINSAHVRNVLVPMMGELVPVSLDDSINSAVGE